MKLKDISFASKTFVMVLCVMLMGFGTAFMYKSAIGSDPIAIFTEGLSKFLHVSRGMGVLIYNAIMTLVVLVAYRSKLGPGTIISLVVGVFVNIGTSVLDRFIPESRGLLFGVFLNIVGSGFLGTGIGIYLNLDFGCSPTDGGVLWIGKMLSLNFRWSLWILYVITGTLGLIMGGVAGIGTAISFLVIGWVSNKILNIVGKGFSKRKNYNKM